MSLSFCQASGIISMTACAMSRPVRTSSSSTASKEPESDWEAGTMGSSCSRKDCGSIRYRQQVDEVAHGAEGETG